MNDFSFTETHTNKSFDDVRILEIGDRALFASTFPDNTLLLWTGIQKIAPKANQQNFGPHNTHLLLRALQGGSSFDIIICHSPLHNPLSGRWILRLLGQPFTFFPATLWRTCGTRFLHLPTQTPLAVLDTEDITAINRHNFFLFPACRAYFKRELPPDYWAVFFKTAHRNLPTARFRHRPFFRQCVDKLHPLALGISEAKVQQILALPPETFHKSTDVFFAGTLTNSQVRERGIEQLRALRDAGYRIDIAEPNLSQEEYFTRAARAWLIWSPEGFGWDCFRHYESAVCRAVPVINQPTIYRHQPLLNGVHCFYYDVEGEGLQQTIVQALHDKEILATMAQAAHAHVLLHHTQRHLCEYILETTIGASA